METPIFKTEMVSIEGLKPASYNPRTLSQHQFESLQRSIDEFGWVEPVVVNKRTGNIVGGHQRVQAARAMGIKEVPVVYVDLDGKREQALNIGLNKISGEFDTDMLAELMASMEEDMKALTGFTDEEIEKLQDGWAEEPSVVENKPERAKSYTKLELFDFCSNFTNPEVAREFVEWLP